MEPDAFRDLENIENPKSESVSMEVGTTEKPTNTTSDTEPIDTPGSALTSTSTLVEFTCEDSENRRENQEIPEAFRDLENIENPKSESVSMEVGTTEKPTNTTSDTEPIDTPGSALTSTSTLVEFTCEDSENRRENQEIPEAFRDLENIENPKSESVSTEVGTTEKPTNTTVPVIEQVRVRLEELKLADKEKDGTTPLEERRSASPVVSEWIASLPDDLLKVLNTTIVHEEKKGTDSPTKDDSTECGSSNTISITSIETSIKAPQSFKSNFDSGDSSGNESDDTVVLNNSGSVNSDKIPNAPEGLQNLATNEQKQIDNFVVSKEQLVFEQDQRLKSTGELDRYSQIDLLTSDASLNSKNLKANLQKLKVEESIIDSPDLIDISGNSNNDFNVNVIFTEDELSRSFINTESPKLDNDIKNVKYEFIGELVLDIIEKLPLNCASDTNTVVSPRGETLFSSNTHGDNINICDTDNSVSDSIVARKKKEEQRKLKLEKESFYYSKLLELAMELRQEQTTAPPENSETPWKWIPLEQPAMPYDISWMQFCDTTNLEDNCLFKVLLKDLGSQPLEAMYFGKLLKVANYLLKEKFKQDTQQLVEDENMDHKSQQLEPSEYKDILKQSHEILYEEYKKKYEVRVRKLLDLSNLTHESSNANTSYSDRSPLIKLENIARKITKPDNIETGAKPEAVVGKENVNTGVATLGVPQYDFSTFSDSPAKGTRRRDTLFRLFDPLYETVFIKDPSLPSPESLLKGSNTLKPVLTPKGKSGIILPDDYEKQLNDVYNKVFTQIKEEIEDPAVDLDLTELPTNIKVLKLRMDDAIEDKMKMEQELNQLKLYINQLQQERASLELELHQKDEVILKTQGEAQKKNNQFKQEIKVLQDKLSTLSEVETNDEVQLLHQQIETHKQTESNLNGTIVELKDKIVAFENIMREYEDMIGKIVPESEKLKIEHDTAKRHLATLEIAFADVHTKYVRCKEIIIGYKQNEETLTGTLEKSKLAAQKYEDRYETLKAHAKAQLEKANKELAGMKEKHQAELSKLTTIIRRLEIKNGSIQQALDQKTKECTELAQLCDEMAGPAP